MINIKTWTIESKFNLSDLDRIESNINDIITQLEAINYTVRNLTIITDRRNSLYETAQSMSRIETNIDALAEDFITPLNFALKTNWNNNIPVTIEQLNRLEIKIKQIYDLIDIFKLQYNNMYSYCNDSNYCGMQIL